MNFTTSRGMSQNTPFRHRKLKKIVASPQILPSGERHILPHTLFPRRIQGFDTMRSRAVFRSKTYVVILKNTRKTAIIFSSS